MSTKIISSLCIKSPASVGGRGCGLPNILFLFGCRSLSFVSRRVLRVGGTATLGLSSTRQRECQNKSDSMYVTVARSRREIRYKRDF